MASTKTMRAIDRLRKAANLEATKKEVTLSDGTVFEMWVTPLTLAEKERAQKMAKSDDANEFALRLLLTKAQDENGEKLFQPGEIDVLKNEVRDSDLQKLMLSIIRRRGRTFRPKRLSAELRKDNLMMLQFGIAKELGMSLAEVRQMTLEEVIGWSAYFQVLNEDQEKEMEKARRRR